MTTTIEALGQAFSPGAKVELFELDFSPLNDPTVFRFANDITESGEIVSFGGNLYLPIPIGAQGFAWSKGKQPRPTLTVGNLDNALTPTLLASGDMCGVIVTRIRTYARFLDSGEQPDGTMVRSREIFRIRRKTRDDGKVVTFELSTLLDFQGVTLPRRRMNRDFCTRVYRHFDPTAPSTLPAGQRFTNDPKVDCPYTGDTLYTREGVLTTDPSKDACSKHIETGCKPRFGENASLPAYSFPGMGLIRPR